VVNNAVKDEVKDEIKGKDKKGKVKVTQTKADTMGDVKTQRPPPPLSRSGRAPTGTLGPAAAMSYPSYSALASSTPSPSPSTSFLSISLVC
jgi:hypothetical protein